MADMTTLQQSLINAKRVMNKVDGGNLSSGNVTSQSHTVTDSSGLMSETSVPALPSVDINSAKQDLSPKSRMTETLINKSKLPDVIKQAMINSPIPDIPFNGGSVGLSEEFLSGVKTQMNKQGIPTSSEVINTTQQNSVPSTPTTKKITSKNLKSIIKESVKELLDETIGFKKNSNENFQFRVGDRIFYGKITSSKSVK
tara:strand:- start:809 stop:1405 length:597 start_codon:yes stop_codon:yes gene_type:complete